MSSNRKITALQSARGIAATVVLVSHCLLTYPTTGWVKVVSDVLRKGSLTSVIFFFVLSGYVLALSLQKSELGPVDALRFYVRRGFRIYPALWLACILALIYAVFVHHAYPWDGLTSWFTNRYQRMTPALIVASFIGLIPVLVPPAWSILVELVGSTLMPLIAKTLRVPVLLAVLFLVLLAGSFRFPLMLGNGGRYAVDFVVGAAMIPLAPILAPALRKFHGMPALIAMIVYSLTMECFIEPGHIGIVLICGLVVGTILSDPGWKILSSRAFAELGDISYSIYILHFPILCFFVAAINSTVTATAEVKALILVVCTATTTILASRVAYRLVELPGIELGKAALRYVFERASADKPLLKDAA